MAPSVLFTVGSRANWGSSCAVIREWAKRGHPFRVLCYASATDPLYGDVASDIERELGHDKYFGLNGGVLRGSGLVPGHRSAPLTASLALMQELSDEPVVYVVGDRYEVLAIAYTARLTGRTIVHQMAGERSGQVDDYVRDAISALSDLRLTATEEAYNRVVNAGYRGETSQTGCPRIDTAKAAEPAPEHTIMLILHPADGEDTIKPALHGASFAAIKMGVPLHVFWPNCDPGNQNIVEAIRKTGVEQTHRNLSPERFYSYLKSAHCIVGNSSVIVREAAALGVPGVLVGDRQRGRPLLGAFPCTAQSSEAVEQAIRVAIQMKRAQFLEYGDGTAAERICDILEATCTY